MSRTDNTRPLRLQIREVHGNLLGDRRSHTEIGRETVLQEHRARQRVRLTLARGEEPEPTRHRHAARHDH
ncbi:hypothetical protein [Spongiactinospora gelatinilytica]|uniref:hypothetical protein n=1 Tax=Spongiactinospora gelatinilytica TaxID=2666298 RepID=UPI0011B9369F|nr:hypothetical protein [Spongiactinospora gelatinilytica]